MRGPLSFALLFGLSLSSLAFAADDVDALVKQLKTRIDTKNHGDLVYSPSMHDRLAGWLPHLDRNDRLDAELLSNTRAFAEGDINAQVFLLYLREAHLKPTKRRLRLTELSAAAGHGPSIYEWATMLLTGDGQARDLDKGIQWMRKSADAGHAPAMNYLGDVFRRGHHHVPRDDAASVAWFRKAAAAGSPLGMLRLGEAMSHGRGAGKDQDGAKRQFEAARKAAAKGAEQGDTESMYVLGYLLTDDGEQGIATDYDAGMKWTRKAALAGHAYAMNLLAYLYHTGKGVEKDEKEAIKWWKKAAEQKQINAIEWLARVYREGMGVPRDYRQTMKYYMEAAELGSAFSMNEVGYMNDAGLGVSVDYKKAMSWYIKAAAMNHAMGTSNVGMLHGYGKGVPKDVTEAIVWWEKAVQLGAAPAMAAMAREYESGEHVAKDEAHAIELMRRAAAQGYEPAIQWLKERGLVPST